jgi:hypothetical protein
MLKIVMKVFERFLTHSEHSITSHGLLLVYRSLQILNNTAFDV